MICESDPSLVAMILFAPLQLPIWVGHPRYGDDVGTDILNICVAAQTDVSDISRGIVSDLPLSL